LLLLCLIGTALPVGTPRASAQAPLAGPAPRTELPAPLGPALPPAGQALVLEDYQIEGVLHIDPVRSKLLKMQFPVARIAITDPNVLEVIQYGPDELEFYGRRSGETTLTIWFALPNAPPRILRFLVRVEPDQGSQIRAEREYKLLEARLNELFPNSQIQLIPVMDKLIVRGQARDSEEAAQIMGVLQGQSANANQGYLGPAQGSVGLIPGAEDLLRYSVVSLMEVPGEHQVMLKVRIAELNRTALRELGLDFAVLEDHIAVAHNVAGAANLSAILDDADLSLFLRAVSGNGNSKILAEPTLVTLSGRTATFLAGGEFAVPTVVGVDGVGAATTTFRGFGTQLAFTPTVIDKDRIRLIVQPSFSTINNENSVGWPSPA
jgi:pilus assembly protein CpaC